VAPTQKLDFPPTFASVLELIAALRSENGCPWDRKQTPDSMTVYLIEEVFELVDAIATDDVPAVLEELGDVLFQVLFIFYLYDQAQRFSPADVLRKNLDKMVGRHPHVFGTDTVADADDVKQRWREIKQREKGAAADSLMDSVPAGLPALMRAYRISERAVGAGFEWKDLAGVVAQAESEWHEFKTELNNLTDDDVDARHRAEEEMGDVLFTLINVARKAGIHPERALAASTRKFIRRFKLMEDMAASEGKNVAEIPRNKLESFWEAAKKDKTGL